MAEIDFVCGVIPDEAGRVWMVERLDHNQWELPGGKIQPGEMALGALERAMHDDWGVRITGVRELTEDPRTFVQGDNIYKCRWELITSYAGKLFVVQNQLYGEHPAYVNPHGLSAKRRFPPSPNAENFIDAVRNEIIDIRR